MTSQPSLLIVHHSEQDLVFSHVEPYGRYDS
jgi:hypothetical protein